MAAFAQWLIGFLRTALTWLYNNGIDFVQSAMDLFVTFILSLVSLFPTVALPSGAPEKPAGDLLTFCLTAINWLLPMQYLLLVVTFMGAGVLAYWTIAPIARWAKLLS